MMPKNLAIFSLIAVLSCGLVVSTASAMISENMPMGMMTPKKQLMHGVLIHDVKCGTGMALIIKSSDSSPACVKSTTAAKLTAMGWSMNQSFMQDKTANNKANEQPAKIASPQIKKIDNSQYRKAPGLFGITGYINTTPEKLSSNMKGKVILYQFWTFNCGNCRNTLPHIVDLESKYGNKGLLIIGIHSPETSFEKDPQNVQDAVTKFGIKYPVVLDTDYQTWNALGIIIGLENI
jgi:thiol-disulfide isomerase/thioredoxin